MKMTFSKSAYDVQDGKVNARFEGVTLKDATGKLDQQGRPMPPGMTWDFTVLDGPDAGKKADRLTGRLPTPKSGCGKMLAGISDSVLKDGTEVDLSQFVGKTYRITIEDGRVSDNPAPVRVYDPAAGGAPKLPPPPPGAAPAAKPEPADDSRWQVWDAHTSSYVLMTARELRAYMGEQKMVPSSVSCCPDGSQDVRTADLHGFTGLPF